MKIKIQKGFTLIELMITVAIVGILSSIAIPNYRDYVLRAQVTEGITQLSGFRVKLEQYFQDNRSYVGACANGTIAPIPTNLKFFTISCANLGADTYTITATGNNGFTYTIDQDNNRSTVAVPSGWPTNANCWVIKKNGQCQ